MRRLYRSNQRPSRRRRVLRRIQHGPHIITKKCLYCNSPVHVVVDKDSPVKRVKHVKNWGAENLEYSFNMVHTKSKELDVCFYHMKNRP